MAAVYPAGPEPMITRFSTPVIKNTLSLSYPEYLKFQTYCIKQNVTNYFSLYQGNYSVEND